MIKGQIPTDDQQYLQQEVVQRLAQAIVRILDMPQMLEQVQQSLGELAGQIAQIEQAQALHGRTLQRSEGAIQKLTEAIEAFYQKQDCLEQASERFSLLSQQHYDSHVIEPLVRCVFPLVDMLSEAASADNGDGDLFKAFIADLHELLATYGVEPIQAATGSIFDPKTMQPVEFAPTCNRKDDKLVESMVRQGFRRGDRILRPAMVVIYRFDGSKQTSSNSRKERQGA